MSEVTKEGNFAAELWSYIDDIRSNASSEEKGWVVGQMIAKYCTNLVIQYAS